MSHPVLDQVRKRIEQASARYEEVAAEIGVTTQSLVRHLSGEYVRSDSIAKYRLWLDRSEGKPAGSVRVLRDVQRELPFTERRAQPVRPRMLWQEPQIPDQPWRVVDIFSGCGGLSLGFQRFENGRIFDTVLALDFEAPMIRVFNDNHPKGDAELARGREADVTDFLNETEIQAYYLDHLARSGQAPMLLEELADLAGQDLRMLRANLHLLDRQFLDKLDEIRATAGFIAEYRGMGSAVLGQTSVIAFHRALKLPMTAVGPARLGLLLWSGDGNAPELDSLNMEIDADLIAVRQRMARREWDAELKKLDGRSLGSGTGQLSSSAKRIQKFVGFAQGEPMAAVRRAWVNWKARREALRIGVFDHPRVQRRVQALYNDGHQVSVLLGGPPCQGFSRIGRGKIRSLREQSVHAHENEESVDSRNQLLEQYVLFVAALSPQIFLFENVRGFQAVVRTGEREFDAAEALARAIEDVSSRGVSYEVASRIVDASEHLVPQLRERYLMVGIRRDITAALDEEITPAWCLTLPVHPPVPLAVPLEDLPEPAMAREESATGEAAGLVKVLDSNHLDCLDEAALVRRWISGGGGVADSHIARRPREDDAAFFDLMGPGKRWMDYRCDESPTLHRLAQLVGAVARALETTPALAKKLAVEPSEASALAGMLDGSLSLRLLLESIPPMPGETHHHLTNANYLKKKEGQHGDWLSRMDPNRPSKTMVSHMAKDTYAYVHPTRPRTLSIREAARIQTFPDAYRFASVGLVDAFRMIGNAVPPLLSAQFAERIAQVLWAAQNEAPGETPEAMPRAINAL